MMPHCCHHASASSSGSYAKMLTTACRERSASVLSLPTRPRKEAEHLQTHLLHLLGRLERSDRLDAALAQSLIAPFRNARRECNGEDVARCICGDTCNARLAHFLHCIQEEVDLVLAVQVGEDRAKRTRVADRERRRVGGPGLSSVRWVSRSRVP